MQHLHSHVAFKGSPDFSWDDAVVVTTSDTSFCPEQKQIDGVTQNFKSQQACITGLALGNALNAEKMLIHPLSWSSTRIRRVCRSTLMAETYALSNAVEHGLRTRATIVDMRGQHNVRQLEETASAAMRHVWFTDCESLFAHRISPNTKQVDNKRLAIHLSALKQHIWDSRDDCDEEVDGSKGDYPRWIDTSAMLSDCLTKTMTSGRLNETVSTGIFDTRPIQQTSVVTPTKTTTEPPTKITSRATTTTSRNTNTGDRVAGGAPGEAAGAGKCRGA